MTQCHGTLLTEANLLLINIQTSRNSHAHWATGLAPSSMEINHPVGGRWLHWIPSILEESVMGIDWVNMYIRHQDCHFLPRGICQHDYQRATACLAHWSRSLFNIIVDWGTWVKPRRCSSKAHDHSPHRPYHNQPTPRWWSLIKWWNNFFNHHWGHSLEMDLILHGTVSIPSQ